MMKTLNDSEKNIANHLFNQGITYAQRLVPFHRNFFSY